jgi:hypothetical protein
LFLLCVQVLDRLGRAPIAIFQKFEAAGKVGKLFIVEVRDIFEVPIERVEKP